MQATISTDDITATFTADAECQGEGGDGSPAYDAPRNIEIATLEILGIDATHLLALCPKLTDAVLDMVDESDFEGDGQ